MQRLQAAWDFFQSHRAAWGALLLAIGGYLATLGPEHTRETQLVLAVGGFLAGGGALPSDKQVRAQKEWEQSGVERRQE